MNNRKGINQHLGFLLLIFALSIRIFCAFWLGDSFHPKTWEYETVANNILTGKGFSIGHYKSLIAPLYPYLTALVYFLTNHSHKIMVVFQILISSLTCILVLKIAENIFTREEGLIAAFLVAIHPGLVYYATTNLHAMTVYSFLFILSILILLKLKETGSTKLVLVAGLVLGLSLLERPTIMIFICITFFWLYLNLNMALKERVKKLSLLAAVIFLVIAPWFVRNYIVHDKIIFIQTNQGLTLWLGNNPNATGGAYLPNGQKVISTASPELLKKLQNATELEKQQIFKEAAYQFIKKNPYKFALLFLKKAYYFWWFAPQTGVLYPAKWKVLYKIFYIPLLIMAFLGVIFSQVNKPVPKGGISLILLLLTTIAISHSIYYVELRHRWAIEPLVLIFSAHGFIAIKYALFKKIKK